jgi:hypothetical protein
VAKAVLSFSTRSLLLIFNAYIVWYGNAKCQTGLTTPVSMIEIPVDFSD